MEILLTLAWILFGLPLLMYPMILLANVMSFSAPSKKNKNWRDYFFHFYLIVLTLYPLLYYFCYEYSKRNFASGEVFASVMYLLPLMAVAGSLYWILKKTR